MSKKELAEIALDDNAIDEVQSDQVSTSEAQLTWKAFDRFGRSKIVEKASPRVASDSEAWKKSVTDQLHGQTVAELAKQMNVNTREIGSADYDYDTEVGDDGKITNPYDGASAPDVNEWSDPAEISQAQQDLYHRYASQSDENAPTIDEPSSSNGKTQEQDTDVKSDVSDASDAKTEEVSK